MARISKKKDSAPLITRAEKKDAAKGLIREVLAKKTYKHNDLIDAASKLYTERYSGEDTENINDVKGRIGSVLDIMKKDGDVTFDGGMYALKAVKTSEEPTKTEAVKEEKTTKRRGKAKKETTVAEEVKTQIVAEGKEEKPAKKTAKKTKTVKAEKIQPLPAEKPEPQTTPAPDAEPKKEETEEVLPLPPAPLQPIAPVAPVTPETAPEPMPEVAPKKRGRKAKSAKVEDKAETVAPAEEVKTEKTQEQAPVVEMKTEIAEEPKAEKEPAKEEKPQEKQEEKKAEEGPKGTLMDMSFLFGSVKPTKAEKTPIQEEKSDVKPVEKKEPVKAEMKTVKPVEKLTEKKAPIVKEPAKEQTTAKEQKKALRPVGGVKTATTAENRRVVIGRPLTADERLRETFLRKMRALGGDYFEYYSVYLLERYSMKNGRRLEGMKITAGERDGGIDGEIELTDKLGFKETIYIQSKNWNPDKGDEKLWVVGETLLQQFIGACMCRQAKDGKQHCRGIFITTSRFTPEAKRILDEMSDKIVGYDGNDLYEAAKECQFGVIKKNGEWVLDEHLLSGSKAFFSLY